ncbi:DUF3095 domain-containing protein [Alkalispirochaeta americana]|nr:DUF3095 domain-containing protein [Alkalispirochaeta americana]
MTTSFTSYENMPVIEDFSEIFRSSRFFDLPEDWYVVMTDVRNSTQAIESGLYKEVNTAGSIAVMAISNIRDDMNFPFLFGGDGMTYLIPPDLLNPVKDVLADTRGLVKDVFSLDLRIGLVPVGDVYHRGCELKVAKVCISNSYHQALITGNGVDMAEGLLKDSSPDNPWLVPDDWPRTGQADYAGFTCRWSDVPSSRGETISLIVKARAAESTREVAILQDVFRGVQKILGDETRYHPLSRESLKISRKEMYREQRVMSRQRGGLRYHLQGMILAMMIPMMKLIMSWQIPLRVQGMEIRRLRENFMVNADFQKFDGSLKMVVSATPQEAVLLEDFFRQRREEGLVFYGMHRSDRALMTCLMHMKSGSEVHFIDAADGGYAMAAKSLKAQISQERRG